MAVRYRTQSPLRTGLTCRCPRCGQGRLFSGLLSVRETCEACGLDLRQADTGDGPAVLIILVLGAIIAPLAIWTEVVLEPPVWVHIAVWPSVILGAALAMLRPLKAFMIAMEYRHKIGVAGRSS